MPPRAKNPRRRLSEEEREKNKEQGRTLERTKGPVDKRKTGGPQKTQPRSQEHWSTDDRLTRSLDRYTDRVDYWAMRTNQPLDRSMLDRNPGVQAVQAKVKAEGRVPGWWAHENFYIGADQTNRKGFAKPASKQAYFEAIDTEPGNRTKRKKK